MSEQPNGSVTTEPRVEDDLELVADKNRSFLSRLYTGTGAFEVVGKRRLWFAVTLVMLAICVISIAVRQFSFGIDFEGGTEVALPVQGEVSVEAVTEVFTETFGEAPESVQTAGTGATQTVQVRVEMLNEEQTWAITQALADRFAPEITVNEVSSSDVSSTWGRQITEKMLIALVVFIVIVFVYIAVRFDREMSTAAMAAMFFDLIVTAGIYSLVGWEVTPAMVIGLLTILGFSIYDTVVVFDKVSENTRSVLMTTRRTYAEQANLAVNQTFMRSINTTVISVLPIIALMIIAVWMLGVGTLKDLALVQLVGIVVGTYSSVFLATPLLVSMKERRAEYREHNAKVAARRAGVSPEQAAGAALAGATAGGSTKKRVNPARRVRSTEAGEARSATPTGKRGRVR